MKRKVAVIEAWIKATRQVIMPGTTQLYSRVVIERDYYALGRQVAECWREREDMCLRPTRGWMDLA